MTRPLPIAADHPAKALTKDGEELFSQYLDSSGDPGFLEDVGAGDFTFDPKCFYDPQSERFFILALEVYGDLNEAYITIAISDDSDPNGIWFKYRTGAGINVDGEDYWVDYPGLGFGQDAFFTTGNLFKLGGGGFAGTLFRVFPKEQLLAGEPARRPASRRPSHPRRAHWRAPSRGGRRRRALRASPGPRFTGFKGFAPL